MTAVREAEAVGSDDREPSIAVPALTVDELCRRVHPRVVGALQLYLGDADLARELAQDALVRLVERGPEVVAMERPDAWVLRVAFNLARSRLRRLGAERRAHARSGPAPAASAPVDVAGAVAVRRALAELPPRQRQAVVLRFYGDLPLGEVGAAMGCRPGTVKAHLHQAVTALRAAGLATDPDTEEPR